MDTIRYDTLYRLAHHKNGTVVSPEVSLKHFQNFAEVGAKLRIDHCGSRNIRTFSTVPLLGIFLSTKGEKYE